MLQPADVVTRNDAEVRDPEILEELTGLGEVDDHPPDAARQTQRRPAHDRQRLDDSVVRGLALLPGARQLERGEVLAEGADRGADRHGVVVEDDQQLCLAVADVVEGLEGKPADERGVADHYCNPLHGVAHVPGRGKPLSDREAGASVTAVEDIVLGLDASRKPADTAQLAQRAEPGITARQELMGVGLVARVPHDLVARRLEDPMQGDRNLDDTERGSQMAARLGDGGDDVLSDLGRKASQLFVAEAPQVARALQSGQDCQIFTPGRTPTRPSLGGVLAGRPSAIALSAGQSTASRRLPRTWPRPR